MPDIKEMIHRKKFIVNWISTDHQLAECSQRFVWTNGSSQTFGPELSFT